MDRRTLQAAFIIAIAVVFVVAVAYWRAPEHSRLPLPAGAAEPSIHLAMGNPSGATDDPANANNYLMRKTYFALSYNDERASPNWVSWCLKEADLGPAPRPLEFFPDSDLPFRFHRVMPREYTGSGFDHGHMCPRSDRTSTPEAANATFVMTNVIPQSPACNQKAWAYLEEYCRELVARKHMTLYIVCGPQGRGGVGKHGAADAIGQGRVSVSAKCWKVVLALGNGIGGPDDIRRVGPGTRMIAVVMPNDETVGQNWSRYRTTVKEVETLSGYRFFDRVPSDIIDPLKATADDEHIPAPRPHKAAHALAY